MAAAQDIRRKLLDKLKELFQLDRPDLDFGFYKIMHARAREVTEFIDHQLLAEVERAFSSQGASAAQAEFETAKRNVLDTLGDVLDGDGNLQELYHGSKPGKEYLAAQAKLKAAETQSSGEDSVFYHLYRFFSRYYDNGDFVSMRYHTRETEGKAKPYAIPYGGEEVMLHWANADQYYIKTSEYFNNFTFDPASSAEAQESLETRDLPQDRYKVRFAIVEAAEGEHGNIKEDDRKKRQFFLAAENAVAKNAVGELEIRFEYRVQQETDKLPEEREEALKTRFEAKNKGDCPILHIAAKVLDVLPHLDLPGEYIALLNLAAPTEAVKKRPLLAKYLAKYTARNTSDYFIHKNLRQFLRRELDFYIKNEIMNLDDLDSAEALREDISVIVEIRKIAHKLIDFLGQLEDFQKKLWLKKKFVVQCDYCITLDRVPETFYPEIIRNLKQWKEWERLGFFRLSESTPGQLVIYFDQPQFNNWLVHMNDARIEEIITVKDGSELPTYVFKPVSLKTFPHMMVDTKFFYDGFKNRLLATIEDFDENCDGVLLHSENFQALNLLQERYKEQVKCIYIDPPYNTGNDGFAYKDCYKDSSWLTAMKSSLPLLKSTLKNTGVFFASMGYQEISNYWQLLDSFWGKESNIASLAWKARVKPVNIGEARLRPQKENEFVLGYEKNTSEGLFFPMFSGESRNYPNELNGRKYRLATILKSNRGTNYRSTMSFEINGFTPPEGQRWQGGYDFIKDLFDTEHLEFSDGTPSRRYFEDEEDDERDPFYCYISSKNSGTAESGKNRLNDVVGKFHDFDTVKPCELIEYIIKGSSSKNELILDSYSGSGTTGEVVISLNKNDAWARKYLLIEMGDHFDTVLKPRLQKIVFSENWKDGKPQPISPANLKQTIHHNEVVERGSNGKELTLSFDVELDKQELEVNENFDQHNPFNGISHCIKYMRLESYEDALNNLVMPEKDAKLAKMPPALKEDYLLHYMLDVEAEDSLLNVSDFSNPFGDYKLKVKRPGSDAVDETAVDLMETFNYLIGLRVEQYYRLQSYDAAFKRETDPELPDHYDTRLGFAQSPELKEDGKWKFRKIEGWIPPNPLNPNDGQKKNVLILWRTLTGKPEEDNLMLDWYLGDSINLNEKQAEYNLIYVNGSNNLGADRKEEDHYQVRLIEEEFLRRMWATEEE